MAEPDSVHSATVNLLAKVLVKPFAQLSITTPEEWLLPVDWLAPTVIPVSKGGDRDNCGLEGYKPVSAGNP